MRKMSKITLSLAFVTSVLLSPSFTAHAEKSSYDVSSYPYQQMKQAGMSDKDIQIMKKHNEEELEFINSGKLDKKAENDQKQIQLARKGENPKLAISPENIDQKLQGIMASSSLGTYGDILVAYNASSWGIDFGYPGHAAIVSNSSSYTVESFPADGVQKHFNDWGSRKYVYAMYVKGATASNYSGAARYAEGKIGKPYNWNFINPWNENAFYCSQLVWKAWKTQGIDVDYITIDPIVTPIEIAKSPNTIIYYRN